MDVFFEPQRGSNKPQFSIEVGFFDTVLEIKEKIQKYQSIPIHKQTLVFNGQVLQDHRDVESCEILQNSHIQLVIAASSDIIIHQQQQQQQSDTKQSQLQQQQPIDHPPQQQQQPQSSPSNKMIHLKINIPSSSKTNLPLDMDVNQTISRLKEKIHEMESIPVNRLLVQSSGVELQDHKSLRDCDLVENSQVDVTVIKPSPISPSNNNNNNSTGMIQQQQQGSAVVAATAALTTAGSKKLKLMVLPKCGTKKISVEVNASDNVGELRKELQKLHQRFHFHLPQEGYFFIYKQNVMDDDRSFRWHHVAQGDTIEIFNGSVTGGS